MGVYMARHQKTAVAAPLSVSSPKAISPAEQPTIAAPVVAATPVDDIAKTPGASGAAQTVSARSVAPATSALPAFRPAVVAGPSTKPVLKPSSQPSAVEPPPSIMVGTQTRDSDLGKALPADSVPVPALPAVSVAGNPAPSFVAQPKEPIPGSGLLETSAPGATPPVANITNHLDPPRLVSSPPPVLKANAGGKSMFHLIWYILIGLISGVIAKSVMHEHITIFWTIVLGIIGSIIGGGVTHMFSRPKNERYHPAGLIFSTLGAILVLYICYKLKIHFPQIVSRITFAIMRARVTKAAPRRQAATIMIREAMPATASPTPGIQPIRKSRPKRICVPGTRKISSNIAAI
jgi:uncharacterized membrane protein YeaQ/YmgE (transglycosylase-associated protein family)